MSKSFQVSFADNEKKRMIFKLTPDMKSFLSNLEKEDISDIDFTFNGHDSIKLSELLEMQDETAEFDVVVKYLSYLSNPLSISRPEGLSDNLLYNSPVHNAETYIFYGRIIYLGQPKPSQNNTRWVNFQVKEKRVADVVPRFDPNNQTPVTLWIKQESGANYDFNNWINKYVRVIGVLHDKWIVKVLQVIAEDRTGYNAGGPQI